MPNQPQQKQLNFDSLPRGDKLRMLDDLELSTHYLERSAKPVSGPMQRLVLLRIDSRARQAGSCYEGAASMARVLGCATKTVERARQALIEQNLIACHDKPAKNREGKVTHHYVIVWSEVALRTGHYAKASPDRTDNGSDRTDNGSDRTDNGSDRTDNGFLHKEEARLTVSEAQKETASPSPLTATAAQPRTWEAAEEEVFSCGLSEYRGAIREAKRHGLVASDVIALCEHYVRHADAYRGPGALYHAVKCYRPGHPHDDGRFWPARQLAEIPFDVSSLEPEREAKRQAQAGKLRQARIDSMHKASMQAGEIDRELRLSGHEPLTPAEREKLHS